MMVAKGLGIAAAVVLVLYLFHRLCDWAESKGWIFYRKTRASGNALGASALQLQSVFDSGKAKHILESKERKPSRPPSAGPDAEREVGS